MFLNIMKFVLLIALFIANAPICAMLSPYAGKISTQIRPALPRSYQQLPYRQSYWRMYHQEPISSFKPYRYQPRKYTAEVSQWTKLRSYLTTPKLIPPIAVKTVYLPDVNHLTLVFQYTEDAYARAQDLAQELSQREALNDDDLQKIIESINDKTVYLLPIEVITELISKLPDSAIKARLQAIENIKIEPRSFLEPNIDYFYRSIPLDPVTLEDASIILGLDPDKTTVLDVINRSEDIKFRYLATAQDNKKLSAIIHAVEKAKNIFLKSVRKPLGLRELI